MSSLLNVRQVSVEGCVPSWEVQEQAADSNGNRFHLTEEKKSNAASMRLIHGFTIAEHAKQSRGEHRSFRKTAYKASSQEVNPHYHVAWALRLHALVRSLPDRS